jgi:serine/threonine protein kinase
MFKYRNKFDSVKILDFGLAKTLDNYVDTKSCGTVLYMAPELINKQAYTRSVDIWAL